MGNFKPKIDPALSDFAVSLAKRAGELVMRYYTAPKEIEQKGEINLVTTADRASEELVCSEIREKFSQHGILSEEGSSSQTEADWLWVIDPLDGTTNYAHRYPFFCVSIALQYKGVSQIGVVYEPLRGELFCAVRGQGAMVDGYPIQVSPTDKLSKSFLATGFAYDIRESSCDNLDNFSRFAKSAFAIRRGGSAALDLAYVACGRFDGFWELKLFPWDTAAGILLVEEAGGRTSRFSGDRFSICDRDILATNGRIHQEMMDTLSRSRMPE